MVMTKEQRNEYLRGWYRRNLEKNRKRASERMRIWYKNNPEKAKANADKYREKRNISIKEWEKRNPDKKRAYRRKHYFKFKKHYKLKNREWFKKNKEKIPMYYKKYLLENKTRAFTVQHFEKDIICNLAHLNLSKCLKNKHLQFHHFKYELPVQRIHFTTLCKNCHHGLHRSFI